MKKLLIAGLLAAPMFSFAANTIDMSNLKCGKFQIYAGTTLKEVTDNCKISQSKPYEHTDNLNMSKSYFEDQKALWEVHFTSTSQPGVIKCEFLNGKPDAVVMGCRNSA